MAAKKKSEDGNSVSVTVFVPKGSVREGDIKRSALLAARDNIPVAAYDVVVTIASASDVKTKDGVEGRDYTVEIAFTPRKTTDPEGEEEKVTVDKVLTTLEPLTPARLEEAGVTGSSET